MAKALNAVGVRSDRIAVGGFFHLLAGFVESFTARARRFVQLAEGTREIRKHVGVGTVQSGGTGDDNIVEAIRGAGRAQCGHRGLEAAADTIAGDGVAEFLGHGEAETSAFERWRIVFTAARLDQAHGHGRPRSAADGEEFRSGFQGLKRHACHDL